MIESWTKQISTKHHAYIMAGNFEKLLKELLNFFKKNWGVETHGNPDLIICEYSTFYIDESRDINQKAITKPTGERKIFILSFGLMTREAANSLLKLFEEPIAETFFFLITPCPEKLPPTLRSRLFKIKIRQEDRENDYGEAKKFLGMNLGERFEYTKKLASEISNGEKNRAKALLILESIEEQLSKKYSLSKNNLIFFRQIEKSRSYIADQSSSVKMLFDEVAMAVAEIQNA